MVIYYTSLRMPWKRNEWKIQFFQKTGLRPEFRWSISKNHCNNVAIQNSNDLKRSQGKSKENARKMREKCKRNDEDIPESTSRFAILLWSLLVQIKITVISLECNIAYLDIIFNDVYSWYLCSKSSTPAADPGIKRILQFRSDSLRPAAFPSSQRKDTIPRSIPIMESLTSQTINLKSLYSIEL